MKSFFSEPERQKALENIKALVPHLETQGAARKEFVQEIRNLLDPEAANKEDASDIFFRCPAEDVMDQLRIAEEDTESDVISGGGAAVSLPGALAASVGGSVGISQLFTGFKTAAMNVLNFTTYYEMKDRAGTIGKTGVAVLIDKKIPSQVERVHLVGHSFGGRLVTAAAANSTTR